MQGLNKRVAVVLMVAGCTGAIAACRSAPEPTEPSIPSALSSAPTTSPTATATVAPTPTQPPTPSPSPATPQPTQSPQAATQSPPPAASLPAECNNPQTQTAMNRCAQAEYEQADSQLNQVYQSVKEQLGPDRQTTLVTAEEAWLKFRDAYCEFVQSQFEGGSIQPTVYYGCLTQLTRDRIRSLRGSSSPSSSYEAADQQLNQVYQDLKGLLSEADQALLTDAQLAWIDYRDKHCDYAAGDQQACLAQITEVRVRQLQEQLDVRSR